MLLVAGAAYFAWQHDQGKHERLHPLCAICWMDKIAPAAQAPPDAGPPDAG